MGQLKPRMGPDGIHLFDRSSGVNILVNEVSPPAHLWSKAPRQVSIALTNACDLKCPHCYAPKEPANLRAESLLPWVNQLDTNGCLGVGFGGGEPTLHKDLANICSHIASNTSLAVSLTTHAHHLCDQIAADLHGSLHFIRVSMDGTEATYEKLRGKPFRDLCDRLNVVRALAPFGINFVVNATTIRDIDAAVDLAAEAGASEFLLLPEQPVSGRGGIDQQTSLELYQWVHSYSGQLPLSVSEAGADGLPCSDPLPRESGLRAYAHVDALGRVKRSSFDRVGVPIEGGNIMQALRVLELTRNT